MHSELLSLGASSEKAYEKYAWLIIFVFGLLSVISSPIALLGMPPNPPSPESTTGLTLNQMATRIQGIQNYVSSIARQLGNFMLGMGVLIMGIAAVPFRRGEKKACGRRDLNPGYKLASPILSGNGGLMS